MSELVRLPEHQPSSQDEPRQKPPNLLHPRFGSEACVRAFPPFLRATLLRPTAQPCYAIRLQSAYALHNHHMHVSQAWRRPFLNDVGWPCVVLFAHSWHRCLTAFFVR